MHFLRHYKINIPTTKSHQPPWKCAKTLARENLHFSALAQILDDAVLFFLIELLVHFQSCLKLIITTIHNTQTQNTTTIHMLYASSQSAVACIRQHCRRARIAMLEAAAHQPRIGSESCSEIAVQSTKQWNAKVLAPLAQKRRTKHRITEKNS